MRTALQKVSKHSFSIVCTLQLLGGVKLYFVKKHFLDSLGQFLHYAPWNLGIEINSFFCGLCLHKRVLWTLGSSPFTYIITPLCVIKLEAHARLSYTPPCGQGVMLAATIYKTSWFQHFVECLLSTWTFEFVYAFYRAMLC